MVYRTKHIFLKQKYFNYLLKYKNSIRYDQLNFHFNVECELMKSQKLQKICCEIKFITKLNLKCEIKRQNERKIFGVFF